MKRKRTTPAPQSSTPKKARRQTSEYSLEDEISIAPATIETPTKARQTKGILINGTSTPKGRRLQDGLGSETATPRSQRKVLFTTPTKPQEDDQSESDVPPSTTADRSARRKSARRLLERVTAGDESDGADSEEDILARRIWGGDASEDGADEEAEEGFEDEISVVAPDTPTKRPRGRPRKSDAEKAQTRQRRRSPTPPQNLPPHERYFYENRPGGAKTSNNTFAAHELLSHEEYFDEMKSYEESHQEEMDMLLDFHARAFDQWIFELQNGFNLCLYGYGSKRRVVERFARRLFEIGSIERSSADDQSQKPPTIIIINGYNPTLTPRDILSTIFSTLLPPNSRLPLQPNALLSHLLTTLSSPNHSTTHLYLLLNSIDAPPLRRPATQSLLASLAVHPRLSLLATADTPSFPLLWDLGQRAGRLAWLFHDCTTLAPLGPVETGDVVAACRDALGRAARRGVAGRDGVAFVLKSLPENARALFRLLVAEQLAAGVEDGDGTSGGADASSAEAGVEWGTLYHRAVEDFVCSNEMTFRTLLKEFFDHQMVESRRDALGSERLVAPFRTEELESLLEELVGM